MHFVDEQNDIARSLNLGKNSLQAFFEFTTEFGTRNQSTQIQRHQTLVAQGLRHVTIDDSLRQSFDNGGLADARFPN